MENEHTNDDFLKSLDSKNGFTTPISYFEKSREDVLAKVLAKKNPFVVPESYFEKNKQLILEKSQAKTTRTKYKILPNLRIVASIAAILICVAVLYIFIKPTFNSTTSQNLSQINENELVNYLASNEINLEWLNDTDLPENKPENHKSIELEQYIIDHADEQTLLDEL
jgi:hypothetical protein